MHAILVQINDYQNSGRDTSVILCAKLQIIYLHMPSRYIAVSNCKTKILSEGVYESKQMKKQSKNMADDCKLTAW